VRRLPQPRPGLYRVLLALCLSVACVACGSSPASTAPTPPGSIAIVAPEPGLSASEATSVTLLRQSLAAGGFQLSPVNEPVQPAVPLAFETVPVVVYRIELADPDQGFVLIYDFPAPPAAAAGATSLAHFVGSGFGQTTYPLDALFSVASLGADVIFTWWSPGRASDPAVTGAAIARVAAVGTAVPVTK
jgi:hypothetical protein